MKTISILGATGSVGQNTIDLVSRSPEKYQTVALTCARNIVRLATDAKRLGAKLAVTSEEDLFAPLSEMLSGTGIEVAAGAAAIAEVGARPADIVMSAIVGAAGLPPGLEVLRRGGTLALANKETLVTAGELVMQIV
ncbi:MAG: 1-deoxy-D-xylulose-5-phosphate reductoisomerase, partial [Rhodobacteraceae bacterium]|nr:1-deoxy-D-xylulose-5-phosphate reductoisomerase [Paracoccaceae bacterium]